MKISLKGILEGTWNSIFIKESIEKIAQERIKVCEECPLNSTAQKKNNNYKTFRPDFHCRDCGCNLHAKTRSLSEKCPQGRWVAQLSQEEEFELTKKLKDETHDSNH